MFLQEAAAQIPTFAGIKFADENLFDRQHCLRLADDRFEVKTLRLDPSPAHSVDSFGSAPNQEQ